MRVLRSGLAVGVLVAVVAACSGAPAATQGPGGGGGSTTQPQATVQPVATQPGSGGNTAGWDQYGKVHIEVSGPVQKTGDYGFVPAGSLFGGAQGSSLNFTNDNTSELVSILISPDGTVVVSVTTAEFSAPAAQCTTSNWNMGATSGSGSFDCTAALVILASGATAQGGTVKGTFEAHA